MTPNDEKFLNPALSFNTYWENLSDCFFHYQKNFIKTLHSSFFSQADPFNISTLLTELHQKIYAQPDTFFQAQHTLFNNYMQLYQDFFTQNASGYKTPSSEEKVFKDRRFRHNLWQQNDFYHFLKQAYFIFSDWTEDFLSKIEGLDPGIKRRIAFVIRQFIGALSPTNFIFSNPEILQETLRTNGQNLINGLENLKRDLIKGKGLLHIQTVDHDFFKIGENIAATPGEVIFKNDLIELIHYYPTTSNTYTIPLLIIPPWINKYYIFDLSEKKSFVKWFLDQGYSVYIISWVNPDEKLKHLRFEDYMHKGVLEAVDHIRATTHLPHIHVAGYCIGGTLLAITLSYLAQKKQKKICSASFLTTMLDFKDAGDILFFLGDSLEFLYSKIDQYGYLDAKSINMTYSLLRANDMIWYYVINNYFLGKTAQPLDLLYWNDDSTHMPGAMMKFFLENMYQKNLLIQAGKMAFSDVKINLADINIPCFIMAAKEDHIAPWQNTYTSTQLISGSIKYVLSDSGHVAGMLNAPSLNKYCYWTQEDQKNYPADGQDWFNHTQQYQGSWWPEWAQWLKAINKEKIKARRPDQNTAKPLYKAPGQYVHVNRI